jgi:hypothetical protein
MNAHLVHSFFKRQKLKALWKIKGRPKGGNRLPLIFLKFKLTNLGLDNQNSVLNLLCC